MSYLDEINELQHSVTLGPYQFNLNLTFTEIERTECSRVSKAISLKFVEMLLIPEVLKPFRQTCENETYVVRPFISKRKDDNCWLYDYHLFITKELVGSLTDLSVETDGFEHENENNNGGNQLPASISGSPDDFDLTITSSLENKIDTDFWSQRLNFGLKLADSYTLRSKLSQLNNLGMALDNINSKPEYSQDFADFELFDSIASSYKDIGPPEVDENIATHNTTDLHFSAQDVASGVDSVTITPATMNFSIGMGSLLGAGSQSEINENIGITSRCDHQMIENTDSQETICDISSMCQENTDSQLMSESERESAENTPPLIHGKDVQKPSSDDNQHVSIDENDSQPDTVYFDAAQSPVQDHSSLSDTEYKSPVTSPTENICFAASQVYKSQLYNDVAGSLNLPDSIPEQVEESE